MITAATILALVVGALPIKALGTDCPATPSNLVRKGDFLELHNQARELCGKADPLAWNESLACYAQRLANRCQFIHSQRKGVGENIAAGYGNGYDIEKAVQSWFDEFKETGWKVSDGYTEASGHATQMAWRSTTQVGCGVKQCSASSLGLSSGNEPSIFVVCQYWIAGNVIGEFQNQVVVPTGSPSISLSAPSKQSKIDSKVQQKGQQQKKTIEKKVSHPPTIDHKDTSMKLESSPARKTSVGCHMGSQTCKTNDRFQLNNWISNAKTAVGDGKLSSFSYWWSSGSQKRNTDHFAEPVKRAETLTRKGTPRLVSRSIEHQRFKKRRSHGHHH